MPPHLDPQHTIRMHCQHTLVLSNSPVNPNALPSRCHNLSCTRTQTCLETTTYNPVFKLHALQQLSTLFTTMALGVEPTMLKSSPPSQFNQRPNFPTHEPSPLAIPQPCYNFHPHLPTTPYAAPITHADTGNTVISSQTQQPKTYGFALLPMNSAILLKDSLTNTLILLTPSSSSHQQGSPDK